MSPKKIEKTEDGHVIYNGSLNTPDKEDIVEELKSEGIEVIEVDSIISSDSKKPDFDNMSSGELVDFIFDNDPIVKKDVSESEFLRDNFRKFPISLLVRLADSVFVGDSPFGRRKQVSNA